MQKSQTYLGDGVYAYFDGYQVWIYKSNGIEHSEAIALEPDVLHALNEYDKKVRATDSATPRD